MTGSSLAPLIISIAGTLCLIAWLTLVLWSDRRIWPVRQAPAHAGPRRRAQFRAIFEAER